MPRLVRFLTQPTAAVRESFYSIDVVRGLAAISILIFHYTHFTMGNGALAIAPARLNEVPILRDLAWIRANGAMAVQLFWAISGFVFMNIYAGTPVTARVFFANRFARLYPLHVLTLLLVAAIQVISMGSFGHFLIYQANSAGDFVLQLLFASAWVDTVHHSFNGPIWSVSVEILIYLLFWIYVRTVRPSLLTAGALAAMFMVVSAVTHNLVTLCGAFFFAGAATYGLFVHTPAAHRRTAMLTAIAVFVAWALLLMSGRLGGLPLTIRLFGLFLPSLLALALSETMGLQSFYKKFRVIGDITYSTYLWHSPLQMLFLLGAGFGLYPVTASLGNGFVFAYLAVVILVSYASFRLIERPAQAYLRTRLLQTRQQPRIITAP
jgi:peptidoglycan/LPS O-acetylase OafA/YrhL